MASSAQIDLTALSCAVANPAAPDAPPVPDSLEEAGLTPTFIEQHLFRMLYFRGEMVGRDIARAMGLSFSLVEPTLEQMKRLQLVSIKRSAAVGNVSAAFALSEVGRHHAREYLDFNQYVGPAPVPLEQYAERVRRQRPPEGWLTPEALAAGYSRMVMNPALLAALGPAISSNNSFLIYGQPGNGKTFIAENLINLFDTEIYLPYAIEAQGAIIQIYDSLFHHAIEEPESLTALSMAPAYDRRWFRCRRPFIMSGGELILSMLDLSYNPVSKIYDAPLQLKANNGIYLIDDFGRQRVTPAEVLNRWIVPMERKVDYLTLRTGGKITVPFDAFLVFSTNLRPDQLGDEAFLRRIQYKMHLKNPTEGEFADIFRRICETKGLDCPPGVLEGYLEKRYRTTGKRMRRCHPRDVLSHALDLIHFERRPMRLTPELLDHAFESCFVEVGDMEA